MGLEIEREEFSDDDHARFARRLRECLDALAEVLARPGFGAGPTTVGSELELNVVDARGRPLPRNLAILGEADDGRVTLELDRFNLEINGPPRPLAGRPFSTLASDLGDALAVVERAAAEHGGRIAAVGILPTLRREHLSPEALTDARRYRALSNGIRRLRRAPFRFRIAGAEPLDIEWDDVTFEGANTSLQIHLRVAPEDFARAYNATQIATAPVLAVAGNSPVFLEHFLWDETRIALFRQATDDRYDADPGDADDWRPARVSFGHGWVRRGIHELFAENVAMHAALLPVVGDEDPIAIARAGGVPRLAELRLHGGTVWRWNRAIYDPDAGGHLRIEMRALPAGPTLVDMAANAAFAVGLTLGLLPRAEALVTSLTFGQARRNFYAAAQRGLDAELLWPSDAAPSPRPQRADRLVQSLLPIARAGLTAHGVDGDEADRMLGVIAARAELGQTGARWQRRTLAALERGMPRSDALAAMLERYLRCAATGEPVHRWPVEGAS